MAWKRDEDRDASPGPRPFGRGADGGPHADTAQRRLEGIRAGVLLERERELRAHALDAYDSLDEASERLIAAIVRLVEARAAWSRLYEDARESASRHAVAADRARVGRLAPPQQAPWPTKREHPSIWNLLQPDAPVQAIEPDRVKAELRSWVMGWHSEREEQRVRRLYPLEPGDEPDERQPAPASDQDGSQAPTGGGGQSAEAGPATPHAVLRPLTRLIPTDAPAEGPADELEAGAGHGRAADGASYHSDEVVAHGLGLAPAESAEAGQDPEVGPGEVEASERDAGFSMADEDPPVPAWLTGATSRLDPPGGGRVMSWSAVPTEPVFARNDAAFAPVAPEGSVPGANPVDVLGLPEAPDPVGSSPEAADAEMDVPVHHGPDDVVAAVGVGDRDRKFAAGAHATRFETPAGDDPEASSAADLRTAEGAVVAAFLLHGTGE